MSQNKTRIFYMYTSYRRIFFYTLIKPIHTTWLTELYNYFTCDTGKVVDLNGRTKAGILGVVRTMLITNSTLIMRS